MLIKLTGGFVLSQTQTGLPVLQLDQQVFISWSVGGSSVEMQLLLLVIVSVALREADGEFLFITLAAR